MDHNGRRGQKGEHSCMGLQWGPPGTCVWTWGEAGCKRDYEECYGGISVAGTREWRCVDVSMVLGGWCEVEASVWQGDEGTGIGCVREGVQEWLSDDPGDRWRAW